MRQGTAVRGVEPGRDGAAAAVGVLGAVEGTSLVRLVGRVDVATAAAVRELLHAAVDACGGVLVVDLSAVELLDATGLGVLAGTHRRAERRGRQVVLRAVPIRTARLLRLTRLARLLRPELLAA